MARTPETYLNDGEVSDSHARKFLLDSAQEECANYFQKTGQQPPLRRYVAIPNSTQIPETDPIHKHFFVEQLHNWVFCGYTKEEALVSYWDWVNTNLATYTPVDVYPRGTPTPAMIDIQFSPNFGDWFGFLWEVGEEPEEHYATGAKLTKSAS